MVQHTTTSEASASPTPKPMGHFRADLTGSLPPAASPGGAAYWDCSFLVHTRVSAHKTTHIYICKCIYTHSHTHKKCHFVFIHTRLHLYHTNSFYTAGSTGVDDEVKKAISTAAQLLNISQY